MSKASAPSREGNTQLIERDQWNSFLTNFTREYRGAHARLDVVGSEVGYQVETDDRPFDGVSADTKDGECAVWIIFGSTPENHLTHGVRDVSAIWVLRPVGKGGAVLEVEARDGVRTVLELTSPEAYALPPATS
jgi:hypothetical protein